MEIIKKESLLKLEKEEIIEYKDEVIIRVLDSRYKWMAGAIVAYVILGLLTLKFIIVPFITQ